MHMGVHRGGGCRLCTVEVLTRIVSPRARSALRRQQDQQRKQRDQRRCQRRQPCGAATRRRRLACRPGAAAGRLPAAPAHGASSARAPGRLRGTAAAGAKAARCEPAGHAGLEARCGGSAPARLDALPARQRRCAPRDRLRRSSSPGATQMRSPGESRKRCGMRASRKRASCASRSSPGRSARCGGSRQPPSSCERVGGVGRRDSQDRSRQPACGAPRLGCRAAGQAHPLLRTAMLGPGRRQPSRQPGRRPPRRAPKCAQPQAAIQPAAAWHMQGSTRHLPAAARSAAWGRAPAGTTGSAAPAASRGPATPRGRARGL